MEIDDIRGVNSSGAISKLLAFELIREDGKKEVIGRPNLYVTTDYFLDYMGINHLDELPIVDEAELIAEESQLFGEWQVHSIRDVFWTLSSFEGGTASPIYHFSSC